MHLWTSPEPISEPRPVSVTTGWGGGQKHRNPNTTRRLTPSLYSCEPPRLQHIARAQQPLSSSSSSFKKIKKSTNTQLPLITASWFLFSFFFHRFSVTLTEHGGRRQGRLLLVVGPVHPLSCPAAAAVGIRRLHVAAHDHSC